MNLAIITANGYSTVKLQRYCFSLINFFAYNMYVHDIFNLLYLNKCMDFEWDSEKCKANLIKHGIDFEFAKEIFSGVWISKPDNRKDYGENRFIAIGVLEE